MMPSFPSSTPVNQDAVCRALLTRLEWVSMAPLDRPVVPPVYTRAATSSALTSACGTGGKEPRMRSDHQVTSAPAATGGHGRPSARASRFCFSGASLLMGKPR